ncbi:hypothetical protein C8R46DRAFT_1218492 [Mycena filopes]|nr:hypothetical protein C8R46DRAFT_1218492 [Mycena filopes]
MAAFPQLPVELLQQIIYAAWNLPLSSAERISFMRASPLVNSTWAELFQAEWTRDVYIPSAAFAEHLIRRLRDEPAALANPSVHPDQNARIRLPMGAVLDELLENLDARSLAPNLRRLSIEYIDAGFDDVFQRVGLAALPPQVTHLDLRYTFSPGMPSWLLASMREKQREKQTLKDRDSIVRDVLAACLNTDVLEVDGCIGSIATQ